MGTVATTVAFFCCWYVCSAATTASSTATAVIATVKIDITTIASTISCHWHLALLTAASLQWNLQQFYTISSGFSFLYHWPYREEQSGIGITSKHHCHVIWSVGIGASCQSFTYLFVVWLMSYYGENLPLFFGSNRQDVCSISLYYR